MSAEAAVGHAAGTDKELCRDYSEEETGDVGKVGYAAGFCLGDYADVEDLHDEPEADEEDRWNAGDGEEDEKEHKCADAVTRKGDEEGAHNCGDGSAGAKSGYAREGVTEDLREHRDDASDEIEDGEAEGAHGIFDFAAEGPQINHVADDVHPACMHEHGSKYRDPCITVDDADGNGGPYPNKLVTVGQFFEKHPGIENDDEDGGEGETGRRTGSIPERNDTTHYIPPLPRRIPMP
jgi:hypothetical protein